MLGFVKREAGMNHREWGRGIWGPGIPCGPPLLLEAQRISNLPWIDSTHPGILFRFYRILFMFFKIPLPKFNLTIRKVTLGPFFMRPLPRMTDLSHNFMFKPLDSAKGLFTSSLPALSPCILSLSKVWFRQVVLFSFYVEGSNRDSKYIGFYNHLKKYILVHPVI